MTETLTGYEGFHNTLNAIDGLNIIFEVTDRCVLSCKYCFAKGSHRDCDLHRMDSDLLDAAIQQAFETRHDVVIFEWTGGEAFLAGINFYKQVVASQKRHASKKYMNGVQTSGYLFDKELIDFLVDNEFLISVTIDGPADVHDFNRPAPRNKPSLQRVLATRDYLVERQGSCGAIATVTKRSLGHEAEILDLYRSLGIRYFHSNPYIFCGAHRVRDKAIALTNEEYASYFISQFNAWFGGGKESPTPLILEYILATTAAGGAPHGALCAFGGSCLTNYVTIVPNGDAYPCARLAGMSNMRLGNIKERPLRDILSAESPQMRHLLEDRLVALNDCETRGCPHLSLCNGGCPYYSFIASGGKNIRCRDWACEGKTMVFDYLTGIVGDMKARQESM